MPRKKVATYEPSTAHTVEVLAQYGLPLRCIGSIVHHKEETLHALYDKEIKHGKAIANSKIAKRLFDKAMDGDKACLIFWCKTQMGWSETHRIDHTSSDGSMSPRPALVDPSMFSSEQIKALRGLSNLSAKDDAKTDEGETV